MVKFSFGSRQDTYHGGILTLCAATIIQVYKQGDISKNQHLTFYFSVQIGVHGSY